MSRTPSEPLRVILVPESELERLKAVEENARRIYAPGAMVRDAARAAVELRRLLSLVSEDEARDLKAFLSRR